MYNNFVIGQNVNNARARIRGMLQIPEIPDFQMHRDARIVKRRLGIQLTAPQIRAIRATIAPPLNMLVFGLGNDTPLWMHCNRGGRTVFLENNPAWIHKLRDGVPGVEAYNVEYTTDISQWQRLLGQDRILALPMPPALANVGWDVILVDAPEGWKESTPGRMQSIYAAASLARPGTDVFVHDCNRVVERAYCDRYLGAGQFELVEEVGTLRHYHRR